MKMRMRNVMLGLIIIILVTTKIGYADLNEGLLAYYPFDLDAQDVTINGNDGEFGGDAHVADGVLHLDGDGDYVIVQDSPTLPPTTEGTIALKFNMDPSIYTAHNKPIGLITKMYASTHPWQAEFELQYHHGTPRLMSYLVNDSDWDRINYDRNFADGLWHSMVVVWEAPITGTSYKMYVDGSEVGYYDFTQTSNQHEGIIEKTDIPMYIGRRVHAGLWVYFKGMMDEIRIYDRVLTVDEIDEYVNPNTSPVADAGYDQTVEATSSVGASVILDGSGSTDPDSTPGTNDDIEFFDWFEGLTPLWSGEILNYTFPLGSHNVTLVVTDYSGETDSDKVVIVVEDTTPPEINIDAPEAYGLYPEGNLVLNFSAYDLVSGNIIPPDLSGTLIDAGGFSGPVEPGYIPIPGVYELVVSASDSVPNTATSEHIPFVVYDPTDGFVTGGGWIYSKAGNYMPDPLAEGKANFGFVSKYKKGATEPAGQTEFVFQAGDLNFHSSSYEWLVVTGSDYARFKGTGTINGSGEYKFMLWAGDKEPDTFRIRIWEEDDFGVEAEVYDNGFDQAIGGGSIVIHTK